MYIELTLIVTYYKRFKKNNLMINMYEIYIKNSNLLKKVIQSLMMVSMYNNDNKKAKIFYCKLTWDS